MAKEKKFSFRNVIFYLILLTVSHTVFSQPLTLKQAEILALEKSPEIQSFLARSEALDQAAIAAGQLPDPHLFAGALNVPVDTFKLNQEPMTQVQLGIGQYFPKGKSLHYESLEKKQLSKVEFYKLQAMKIDILQKVRLSWLHLYYWQKTNHIILQQKKVFNHLLKVAESLLANNKAQQKDIIRAQLELTELDNRLIHIAQQIQTAKFELARWIGEPEANKAETKNQLHWPSLPSKMILLEAVEHHPELNADSATIAAHHAKVQLALQQYKPGFNINVGYGIRQGQGIDGKKRPDFLTATVNMDLPVFTHNRQDRTLKASNENLLASEQDRMSHFRDLHELLNIQYAVWQEQQKSNQLFQTALIPQANQYASATMTAYQNFQTDFPTLARAYVRELNTELEGLKVSFERDVARINLLYLQGQ